jgi:ribonuclease P protein component
MLAAKYRFHGHGSLRFVYARGQVKRSKFFICKYSVNHRRAQPRVAVVISKKIIKSAVKRNRVRRRLYEAVRGELPRLEPKSDIVLIVTSPETLTATPTEISAAITSVFTQAGLYKPAEN